MANKKGKFVKPNVPAAKTEVVAPKAPEQPALQLQASAPIVAKPELKPEINVAVKASVASTPKVAHEAVAPVKPAAPRLVTPAPVVAPQAASFKEEAKVTVEAVTRSYEQVANASTAALTDISSTVTAQMQKVQERASAVGVEALEHVSRSADAAVRQVNDALNNSQQHIEVCAQCSQVMGDAFAKITEELFQFVNHSFARNIELSREILSCRTVNDAIEWQNKLLQTNIDGTIEEMSKLSEMMMDATVSLVDPLGEQISKVVDRFAKSVAA